MTYGRLKHLTRALLIGDNTLTRNNDEVLALLDYAYDRLVSEVDVLRLYTGNSNVEVARQGVGSMVLRKPVLPSNDSDELDVDHELGFVLARFICSFVSKERSQVHEIEAQRLARLYNQKIQIAFENFAQDGHLEQHDENDKFGKKLYP